MSAGCHCGWPLSRCNPLLAGFAPCMKVGGATAATREGDPETSRIAAASIGNLSENQRAVMLVLRVLAQPVLDERLIKEYQRMKKALRLPDQSESGLRSRRAELGKGGLLVQGEDKKMSTGGVGRTWTIKTDTNTGGTA